MAENFPLAPALVPTMKEERALWRAGQTPVAGVDEVGRGALAGPVVAGAVILRQNKRPAWLSELRDSKMLTPKERERLAIAIHAEAEACAIGSAAPAVIDTINILQASYVAMERALARLPLPPCYVLVDGPLLPKITCGAKPIIDGDALVCSIAAASIIAKVARDRLMVALDRAYPGYGFPEHKGYSAPVHLQAILDLGVSPVHRRSFAPVRSRLCGDGHLERLLAARLRLTADAVEPDAVEALV
jgi:ribonuclease HII